VIVGAAVFAASLGLAASARALAPHVTVTAPSHLEIIRDGQVTGKMSLAVGTVLDMDGIQGEFVLVHIRLLKGRVPAKDTDVAGGASVPEAAAQPAQPAQASAPHSAAPQALPAQQSGKPAASAPTASPRDMPAMPAATARPGFSRGRAPVPKAVLTVMLAAGILMIVAYWRLFTKAGKPGWAILVPIYNLVVWQQISGKPLWWIVLYFVPVLNLVMSVLAVFSLAGNFGKGKGFGVGLLLLPWVFVPLLAFGDAEFTGTLS
jgi:hypothetical protein